MTMRWIELDDGLGLVNVVHILNIFCDSDRVTVFFACGGFRDILPKGDETAEDIYRRLKAKLLASS